MRQCIVCAAGLTLLIPYLLTQKKRWGSCKMRVFMASAKKTEFDLDQEHKQYALVLLILSITRCFKYILVSLLLAVLALKYHIKH